MSSEEELRVLVCGSRTWPEHNIIIPALLEGLMRDRNSLTLIEGGARGADKCAADWAEKTLGVKHLQFPADWDKYGKSAGYKRNTQMLEEGKPTLVLAFVDKPLDQSRGTAMMVKIAREAHVKIYVTERL